MVESSRAGWTSRVSRRFALALPVAVGLAGCTELAQARDPYMQALKDDPMFSWKPSIAVSRAVELQTREYGLSPGGTTSYAVISLTPHDKNLVHDLLKASVDAMARAGYSDKVPGLDGTRLGGQVNGEDFWIECMVSLDSTKFMGWPTSSTYGMLNIVLSGPYAKA